MAADRVDALVIFGATGDLAKLETFPALVGLVDRGVLDVTRRSATWSPSTDTPAEAGAPGRPTHYYPTGPAGTTPWTSRAGPERSAERTPNS
jgi:hypothetical protein